MDVFQQVLSPERILLLAEKSFGELRRELNKAGLDVQRRWGLDRFYYSLRVEWEYRLGFDGRDHYWEADHIVEVVRGGESTLENTQTLCIPCHKKKTKRLHGELKRERREKVQPSLFPPATSPKAAARARAAG